VVGDALGDALRHHVRVATRAIATPLLAALAGCWPEPADLQTVEIDDSSPASVTVTVVTSTPGFVIERRGSVAGMIQSRLREAVSGRVVSFRVEERRGEDPHEPPQAGSGAPTRPRPSNPSGAQQLSEPQGG
jgi:hypothetical protein